MGTSQHFQMDLLFPVVISQKDQKASKLKKMDLISIKIIRIIESLKLENSFKTIKFK